MPSLDIQVDKQGRVLVGWADGCTGDCVTSTLVAKNSFSAKGVPVAAVATSDLGWPRPDATARTAG